MYKLLLCWRYLRTRYIALVCIVSVMLGVATMIVVNAVMAGFRNEMQTRLNGLLGDVVLESRSMDGAPDAERTMAFIRETIGDEVAGMSPTVVVPALLYAGADGQSITRQITVVGIDAKTYADVSECGDYLQHPANRNQISFDLRDGGYDVIDHKAQAGDDVKPRAFMENAGWPRRRELAKELAARRAAQQQRTAMMTDQVNNPFATADAGDDQPQGSDFDPATEQHQGAVVGMSVLGWRDAAGVDHAYAKPGDDVRVSFPTASMPPKVVNMAYTVVDFYESGMQEYDANYVFVPLEDLQRDRGMVDPTTGIGRFSAIQIKLVDGADADAVRDKLRSVLPLDFFAVSTWRDKQGPLLAAVQMETAVLNVLLFMIIAVAGFGILAIFFMIVVEKTRDIGILKSLGASAAGVMGIFLTYGVSLGAVGAGVGVCIGLAFTHYINEIADVLSVITGQPVFDPAVYYFYKIPTIVNPLTVTWISLGAIGIAIAASVLPALRAARLHPVRALRYE